MSLAGCYRGIVEDVSDPDRRGRIRVRVPAAHPEEVQTEHLPWAELASFGGRRFGDVVHYDVNDRVWVMFENGDREYPVVLGGWLTQRQGITDLLADQVSNYSQNRQRWIRADREGNRIEMSEVPSEPLIRLRSGNTMVELKKHEDSISIEADGDVEVSGARVSVDSTQTFLTSDDVFLSAKGRDDNDNRDGSVNIYSNNLTRVYARDKVLIGQYIDRLESANQSEKVNVQPKDLQLGKGEPQDGTKRTLTVAIEGYNAVDIVSQHRITAKAPRVDVEGSNQVNVSGRNISLSAESRALIKAPRFDVTS